jgi:hypothetical protein
MKFAKYPEVPITEAVVIGRRIKNPVVGMNLPPTILAHTEACTNLTFHNFIGPNSGKALDTDIYTDLVYLYKPWYDYSARVLDYSDTLVIGCVDEQDIQPIQHFLRRGKRVMAYNYGALFPEAHEIEKGSILIPADYSQNQLGLMYWP